MTREDQRTLPLWLSTFTDVNRGTDWGGIMAGSTLIAVPVIIFFLARPGPDGQRAHLGRGEGMNLTPRRSSPPLRSPEQRRGDPEATQSTESRTDDLAHPRAAGAAARLRRHDAARRLPLRCSSEGLGGICYFGSNTADGPAALAALSAEIRAANPAAVVAVDEEGGDVSRLHAREPSPVLGAAALGGAADLELTAAVGRWVGHELAAVGVTLDLAPVADVNSDPDNPVIGTRSFGRGPRAGRRPRRGLDARTPVDRCRGVRQALPRPRRHRHRQPPRPAPLDVDPDTLAARELVPFDAAVEAGTAAVMTSHIVVPAIDPDRPATLSPLVLGLLREVLGFDGVVVSDALDMAGASAVLGIPEAAVLALAAGCDLLCLGPDKPAALVLRGPPTRSSPPSRTAAWRTTGSRTPPRRVAAMRVPATATHPEPARRLPTGRRGRLRDAGRRRRCPTSPAPSSSASTPWPTSRSATWRGASRRTTASTRGRWRTGCRTRSPATYRSSCRCATPADAPRCWPSCARSRRRPAGRRGRVGLAVDRATSASPTISTRGSSAPGVAAVTQLLRGAGWTR